MEEHRSKLIAEIQKYIDKGVYLPYQPRFNIASIEELNRFLEEYKLTYEHIQLEKNFYQSIIGVLMIFARAPISGDAIDRMINPLCYGTKEYHSKLTNYYSNKAINEA